jgi:hypothetical protein
VACFGFASLDRCGDAVIVRVSKIGGLSLPRVTDAFSQSESPQQEGLGCEVVAPMTADSLCGCQCLFVRRWIFLVKYHDCIA